MQTDPTPLLVEVDKKEIAFFVGLFESYDDFAVVRTIDQDRGLVELLHSPDYEREIRELIESLKPEMNVRIVD